jgi:hypothetical protein
VLDERLNAVIQGETPKDNAERLRLSYRAYEKGKHAVSARLFGEVLESDPRLGDDRQAQHRYNAACAAVLAAGGGRRPLTLLSPEGPEGEGKMLADEDRAKLREQARGWLEAELGVWAKVLESADAEQRGAIAKTFQWWQEDRDLTGVRGDAIDELPERECAAWRALWGRVEELLAKARRQADATPSGEPGGVLPTDPFAR